MKSATFAAAANPGTDTNTVETTTARTNCFTSFPSYKCRRLLVSCAQSCLVHKSIVFYSSPERHRRSLLFRGILKNSEKSVCNPPTSPCFWPRTLLTFDSALLYMRSHLARAVHQLFGNLKSSTRRLKLLIGGALPLRAESKTLAEESN